MEFSLSILLTIFGGTFVVTIVGLYFATSVWQKLMIIGIVTGLTIYSGAGIAFSDVPNSYLIYYFVFAINKMVGRKHALGCFLNEKAGKRWWGQGNIVIKALRL